MSVHICTGPRGVVRRRIAHCPVCKGRRRFVQEYGSWWGDTFTCCGCGDRWADSGERMERPFVRGWRRTAIAEARRMWRSAMTPQEFRDAVMADLDAELAAHDTWGREG